MNSNKQRSSPDFIGIGVMKAATSWIFQCLKEHPEVCDHSKKEIHFFDRPQNYSKGIEHYKDLFQDCPPDKMKGEYTPSYIFSREAPKLISKHFPNVKIIACLRNPVDRAVSHYKFNIYRNGRLSIYKDFGQAIRKDKEVIDRGKYYEQLKNYFDLFPKENILVIIYEELKDDPKQEIKKIYEFLGVDNSFVPPSLIQKQNVTGAKKVKSRKPLLAKGFYLFRKWIPRESKRERFLAKLGLYNSLKRVLEKNKKVVAGDIKEDITIKQEDKEYLRDIYKEDTKKLEKLINKDLSAWK